MDYKFFFENYSQEISKLLSNVDTNLIKETVDLIKKKLIQEIQFTLLVMAAVLQLQVM